MQLSIFMKIKKNQIILFLFPLLCFLAINNNLLAQNKGLALSVRIFLQSDFQKADFKDAYFPFEFKQHSSTATNWGIDLLIEKEIHTNWDVYAGIGYFRNKFNFKRAYNHQLLNAGRDSLPIGTSTTNYVFHLLRYPIGISYRILKNSKYDFNLGLEVITNFSFQQVYNGRKPFPNANNKYSKFNYYGNSILFFCRISRQVSRSSFLQIEPNIRVLNIYKRKDPFLFETNSKPYSRTVDAIGLSLKYSFAFNK